MQGAVPISFGRLSEPDSKAILMIKLTVLQLIECVPGLEALAAQTHRGEISFRIRRIVQKVNIELPAAAAARNALITDENSVVDEKGTRSVRPECYPEFLADPLFIQVITLDADPLKISDLEASVITPGQIDQLWPLIAP